MSDSAFRQWISTLPSFLDGTYAEYVNGQGRNAACHVRRASSSGTGFKADYQCVPMTHEQHNIQHCNGELECLLRFNRLQEFTPTVEGAKACFDEAVKFYVELWEAIKDAGYR